MWRVIFMFLLLPMAAGLAIGIVYLYFKGWNAIKDRARKEQEEAKRNAEKIRKHESAP